MWEMYKKEKNREKRKKKKAPKNKTRSLEGPERSRSSGLGEMKRREVVEEKWKLEVEVTVEVLRGDHGGCLVTTLSTQLLPPLLCLGST